MSVGPIEPASTENFMKLARLNQLKLYAREELEAELKRRDEQARQETADLIKRLEDLGFEVKKR